MVLVLLLFTEAVDASYIHKDPLLRGSKQNQKETTIPRIAQSAISKVTVMPSGYSTSSSSPSPSDVRRFLLSPHMLLAV
jgi:hypothetical protein